MRILTLEDKSFEMNELPDEVDDLRFAVLDNSDPKNPDYFYIPLIFLESFNSPALVLDIGGHKIRMPVRHALRRLWRPDRHPSTKCLAPQLPTRQFDRLPSNPGE